MANWYNIPEIISIKSKSYFTAPKIEYKGRSCFASIIEDTIYQRFEEDYEEELKNADMAKKDAMFASYMLDHKEDVYELCQLALFPEKFPECDTT